MPRKAPLEYEIHMRIDQIRSRCREEHQAEDPQRPDHCETQDMVTSDLDIRPDNCETQDMVTSDLDKAQVA